MSEDVGGLILLTLYNSKIYQGLREVTLQCSQTCVGSLFLENSTVLIVSKAVCELEQETKKKIQGESSVHIHVSIMQHQATHNCFMIKALAL